MNIWAKRAGKLTYSARWLLFPLGLGMLLILFAYVTAFLVRDVQFLVHNFRAKLEDFELLALGFVDAYMVANLILMVAQGSFQIFIQRFELGDPTTKAQYLDHLDSGLLKVKVAQSIGGIMFIQLLENFVNIHNEPWADVMHRLIVFAVVVTAALAFAGIWRVTHPSWQAHHEQEEPQGHYDGRKLL
jgi:uncharacterized protein (TIGR00645 family)